jgi:hypothetical protein
MKNMDKGYGLTREVGTEVGGSEDKTPSSGTRTNEYRNDGTKRRIENTYIIKVAGERQHSV